MKKEAVLYLALGVICFTGCRPQPIMPISPAASLSVGITIPATATTLPTRTPEPATPTPRPTPTSTPTIVPGVVQRCFSIQPALPENHKYSGKIAFETYFPGVVNTISFYNLETGKVSELPGADNNDLSVSPDRTKFAFLDWKGRLLEIYSSDIKLIKLLAARASWGTITGWLDNQQLAIVMSEKGSDGWTKYPSDVLVINPFTNQQQRLPSKYPDIDKASRNSSWDKSGTTVYNSTLNRVIYPGGGVKSGEEFTMGYYLYDIPGKKVLAQLPSSTLGNPPVWSPDDSQFIVKKEVEFFLVNINGNITEITHMNPSYHPPENKETKFDAEYYSWSPDNRHVALWLIEEPDKKKEEWNLWKRTLAILDIQTGDIIDTCIPAGYDPYYIRTYPYPVWSPDGRQLVVAANYRNEDEGFDAMLVDLNEQTAYKIADKLFPVGWLIGP